jgi:molecular chaperone GrpE (heat shock protein)
LANLLKQWQVEAIAVVGETVLFDPQWHQLMESELLSEPGTPMIVRYVGYRQGKKLLYRAKVSPIAVTTVPTVEPVTTASSSSPAP